MKATIFHLYHRYTMENVMDPDHKGGLITMYRCLCTNCGEHPIDCLIDTKINYVLNHFRWGQVV